MSDEIECTCIAVKEREESERTGYVKLYEFPEGEDDYGDPCLVHDPGEKNMNVPKPSIEDAKRDRGVQLRALVVSWSEQKTFVEALREQQVQIDAGTLTLNPEWEQVADEILGGFMTVQAQLTAWDEAEKKREEAAGPKLILP